MADDTKSVAPTESSAPSTGYGSGYGKKPMWFWILLYVVIGAVAYYAIYALYFKSDSSNTGLYGTSSSGSSIYGN